MTAARISYKEVSTIKHFSTERQAYSKNDLLLNKGNSTFDLKVDLLLPKGCDISISSAEQKIIDRKEAANINSTRSDADFLRDELSALLDRMSKKKY
jgi:hypothetical protein